jgi:hypothetical protein
MQGVGNCYCWGAHDVMEVAVRKQIMVAEPIGNELQKSAVGVEAYEQHLL